VARYTAVLVARLRVPVPGTFEIAEPEGGEHPVEPSLVAEQEVTARVTEALADLGDVLTVTVELVEQKDEEEEPS
jgi:hypothetical protein